MLIFVLKATETETRVKAQKTNRDLEIKMQPAKDMEQRGETLGVKNRKQKKIFFSWCPQTILYFNQRFSSVSFFHLIYRSAVMKKFEQLEDRDDDDDDADGDNFFSLWILLIVVCWHATNLCWIIVGIEILNSSMFFDCRKG